MHPYRLVCIMRWKSDMVVDMADPPICLAALFMRKCMEAVEGSLMMDWAMVFIWDSIETLTTFASSFYRECAVCKMVVCKMAVCKRERNTNHV